MQVPLSFIKEYIDIDLSTKEIAKIFTDAGIEVEAIENETAPFSNVVAASVLSVQPHPGADRLVVAEVFDGEKNFTIVCGAPNCRPKIKVALAKIGAKLSDQGKTLTIQKTKIRGVESEGMLCSLDELGLASESEGILELPEEIELGKDIASIYAEPIFHFSLTPNLSRCLGVIGLARELAAMTGKKIKQPEITFKESISEKIESFVKIKNVDPDLCSRYSCRVIKLLTKEIKTPFWLKKRLKDCSIQSVNPIVDVLNYVMLEMNQPMHAFDLDTLDRHTLEVTKTETPEIFFGLDAVKRVLPEKSMVIKDEKKILALAGIMGGASSAVTENTQTILIESANFSPISIRRTSKKLQFSTESSLRFERGIDPLTQDIALDRAVSILEKMGGIEIVKGLLDIKKDKKYDQPLHLNLRPKRVNQILGTHLSQSEIEQILERLECETKKSKKDEFLEVKIPSYRNDIKQEIDLIEEIARIYGYNHIEKPRPFCLNSPYPDHPLYTFEKRILECLARQKLQEVISPSLISPKLKETIHGFPSDFFISVLHSKSSEHSVLRPTLLASFLSIIRHNQDQKNFDLGLFESSHVHMLKDGKHLEIPMIGVALVGHKRAWNWFPAKPKEVDFFDLKEIFEKIFESLKISPVTFYPTSYPNFHPSRQAQIIFQNGELGVIGEIHPATLKAFDLKQKVLFGEMNLQLLFQMTPKSSSIEPLPIYPSSERDWTFSVDQQVLIGPLLTSIRCLASPFLENVFLHDLYVDPSKPKEKLVTLRFIYRDTKKTISHEEIEAEHAKILTLFREKYLKIEG